MIPKTVEMLQRPSESSRRSASPHVRRDNKTRYEKDVEEMKIRSLSERKRDGERGVSSETENSQGAMAVPYSSNNRVPDYYGIPRSSSIGMG